MKKAKLKVRNPVARAVRDPQGPYRAKTEVLRTRHTRKIKHKKPVDIENS